MITISQVALVAVVAFAASSEAATVTPIPRIINGQDVVDASRYPFMADLEYSDGSHLCGGALIAPDLVLSAAHCAGRASIVAIGTYNKSAPDPASDVFLSLEEIVHPRFEEDTLDFDFMIVRMNGVSDNAIATVNSDPQSPVQGENVTTIGFGVTSTGFNTEFPTVLQETTLAYVPNEDCEAIKGAGKFGFGREISDVLLCALGEDGRDSCSGDSGGPLLDNQDHIIGVVSWGVGCSDPVYPGIYARTSTAFEWIRSTVCEESASPPDYFRCDLATSITPTPAPTSIVVEDAVELILDIQFDDFPSENGFFLEQLVGFDVDPVARVYPGAFAFESSATRTYMVQRDALYNLQFFDTFEDGFEAGGKVSLKLRDNGQSTVLLSFGPNDFTSVANAFFYASLSQPDDAFYIEPQYASRYLLTLEVTFDAYPEEIATELRSSSAGVLFYRPPRYYYPDQFDTKRETFSIPREGQTEYTFSIADIYGDGLGDVGATGYRLFAGTDIQSGRVLAEGSFTTGSLVRHTFNATDIDILAGLEASSGAVPSLANAAVLYASTIATALLL